MIDTYGTTVTALVVVAAWASESDGENATK